MTANRVADSIHFRKGPKLRVFLLYVRESTLLGRHQNVREQLIGSKIFGRRADYEPCDSNIVRIEARLHTGVARYMLSAGREAKRRIPG